jgi:hypothetical protein
MNHLLAYKITPPVMEWVGRITGVILPSLPEVSNKGCFFHHRRSPSGFRDCGPWRVSTVRMSLGRQLACLDSTPGLLERRWIVQFLSTDRVRIP